MPKWEYGALLLDDQEVAKVRYEPPPIAPSGVVFDGPGPFPSHYSTKGPPGGVYEIVGETGLGFEFYEYIHKHIEESIILQRQDGVRVAVRLVPTDPDGRAGRYVVASGPWPQP